MLPVVPPVVDDEVELLVEEELDELDEVEVLVPGHGSVTDRAGLRARLAADLAYLDALEAGLDPDDPRLADPEQAEAHAAQRQRLVEP